jgi:hypothetical protein
MLLSSSPLITVIVDSINIYIRSYERSRDQDLLLLRVFETITAKGRQVCNRETLKVWCTLISIAVDIIIRNMTAMLTLLCVLCTNLLCSQNKSRNVSDNYRRQSLRHEIQQAFNRTMKMVGRPPLWYSGQSSWLQIQRPGFDSRHYQKKKK